MQFYKKNIFFLSLLFLQIQVFSHNSENTETPKEKTSYTQQLKSICSKPITISSAAILLLVIVFSSNKK